VDANVAKIFQSLKSKYMRQSKISLKGIRWLSKAKWLRKKESYLRYRLGEMWNIVKDVLAKNLAVKKDTASVSQLECHALALADAKAARTARPQ
jgi:hypothetical protein